MSLPDMASPSLWHNGALTGYRFGGTGSRVFSPAATTSRLTAKGQLSLGRFYGKRPRSQPFDINITIIFQPGGFVNKNPRRLPFSVKGDGMQIDILIHIGVML
ncbi:MAG: hypothetical protein IJO80_03765, partial [Firmicutes bacterium]|nr:hypothetical protein [Bacillota bacterium]